MFTTAKTLTTDTPGPTAILARLTGRAWTAAVSLVRATVHRRQVRDLLDLDERSLRDIGLLRTDVIGALCVPILDDPSTILAVRALERSHRARDQRAHDRAP